MGNVAYGIIFVNQNISAGIIDALRTQLFLHEVISYDELAGRVALDGYYIDNNRTRMVVLCDYDQQINRDYADMVIHITRGLCYIEKNKFGPPGQTWSVAYLCIDKLFFRT